MKKNIQTLTLVALALLGSSCAAPAILPKPQVPIDSVPAQQEAALRLGPDIRVDRRKSEVIIRSQIASRNGFLEQLVCKAGTREHESLLAVEAAPKMIHAALLAAGFTAGSPGSWSELPPDAAGNPVLAFQPPTGSAVELFVRWESDGHINERALCEWVRGSVSGAAQSEPAQFPCNRFVFAGSHIRPNPKSLGPGEHYVADYTGSVVGLVTFGDEVIAFEEVIPDRVDVAPAMWESWTDRIPVEGTPIELVIRRPK